MTFHLLIHRMRPIWLLGVFAVILFGTAWSSARMKKLKWSSPTPVFQDGDIVFQSSMKGQGAAIAQATRSPYTHCGIVFMEGGEPVVWEAVGPVKRTAWREFVRHGDGGHYVVKRLRAPLDRSRMAPVMQAGEAMMGTAVRHPFPDG